MQKLIPHNVGMIFAKTVAYGMRVRRRLSVILCAVFLSASLGASSKPSPASQPDYMPALAVVDRFLQAWQSGDAENGMALLTAHAKKAATEETVEKFFSDTGTSAYEIGRGKVLKRNRYEFPVVLVKYADKHLHRQFTSIIVLNTGGADWAVDKLP